MRAGGGMTQRIVRNIPRAEGAVVRALGEQGVATVLEAQGGAGLLRSYLRPIFPEARAAGTAVTVLCSGDNLMIHAAIEVCRPGDILIVASAGEAVAGMFGDLLGTSCQARGIAGLVIDGGVRDVAELSRMRFPVWAKSICALGAPKSAGGSVNVTVACAGAVVRPGDVVVADADGVVVVPRARAAEVARLGAARLEKEAKIRERLARGELTLDVLGLRERLAEAGITYVDEGEP
jgi:4-hydroxy-4-methyl-2-oxoglutarate aldolase